MKVSTDELRRGALALLKHLEESNRSEFELAVDYYWDVPPEIRYDPYVKPTNHSLGQLSDDWEKVQRLQMGLETRSDMGWFGYRR